MTSEKTDYLFVYSSLLRGFGTPDYEYICRYFDFAGTARARGILSIMGDIIVGTPVEDERFIVGELYRIQQPELFSFVIGQLDEYEGLHPEPPEVSKYKRVQSVVYTDDGEEKLAWVYWYAGGVHGLPVIESGDVLEYLNRK
ncbi:MAG TPA: gamma-glutamylcyclotransferase [Ginsengibacter sp.]|mgnify:CR=1 FL=1|nr:gamma-glutamylcyclotransferase [Chitinophagaceae bacterium]HRN74067.1 gamma-glutamylcyclotransferase [Ginsengibacter sp.]HRP45018.1 gamma-glutamylcyclotransferase [Ginsengibacter sp.]